MLSGLHASSCPIATTIHNQNSPQPLSILVTLHALPSRTTWHLHRSHSHPDPTTATQASCCSNSFPFPFAAVPQVWVKPSAEMQFLYGNNVLKSGLARITENTPAYTGVVVFSMSDGEHASTLLPQLLLVACATHATTCLALWPMPVVMHPPKKRPAAVQTADKQLIACRHLPAAVQTPACCSPCFELLLCCRG